jgi:hypothetical protein
MKNMERWPLSPVSTIAFYSRHWRSSGLAPGRGHVGAAAHTAGALALVEGKSVEAATELAMAPIKRRVRANHLRLLRG